MLSRDRFPHHVVRWASCSWPQCTRVFVFAPCAVCSPGIWLSCDLLWQMECGHVIQALRNFGSFQVSFFGSSEQHVRGMSMLLEEPPGEVSLRLHGEKGPVHLTSYLPGPANAPKATSPARPPEEPHSWAQPGLQTCKMLYIAIKMVVPLCHYMLGWFII